MKGNWMHPDNCNKEKCKTCIFGPSPLYIEAWRRREILIYLKTLECSHLCHTTNKNCFGAQEIQARTLYKMGIIPDDKPETMIQMAQIFLNK